MSTPTGVSPTVLQMLERTIGRKVLIILDRAFGYEGTVATVSSDPPGIWLSEAEAVVLRATIANPLPQVISREDRSEVFIHLNSVLRIEVLH
ncbi:MAG: hypothetical protein ACE5Z5_12105 [Candidatus Bathyarchaeia archaeon]